MANHGSLYDLQPNRGAKISYPALAPSFQILLSVELNQTRIDAKGLLFFFRTLVLVHHMAAGTNTRNCCTDRWFTVRRWHKITNRH